LSRLNPDWQSRVSLGGDWVEARSAIAGRLSHPAANIDDDDLQHHGAFYSLIAARGKLMTFGPDGALYVSNWCATAAPIGQILRFEVH
jgi:hypothetical protein